MHVELPQFPLCAPVPARRVLSVPRVLVVSPASRPLYMIDGFVVEFDFVYVIAISPEWSTATEGWKRKNVFAPSGSKLEPCVRFAAIVPPVTFAWYQRTVALPPIVALQFELVALTPRCTVWAS